MALLAAVRVAIGGGLAMAVAAAVGPEPRPRERVHSEGHWRGSPEPVAQKIAANLPALGANRFDLKYGMGGLSHEAVMTNIELYGTQVIPRVRELLN